MFAFPLHEGTAVSVRLAGWDSTVTRKRMSASPILAKMVAPVWTDIMATPACANLDLEVITQIITVVFQHCIFSNTCY